MFGVAGFVKTGAGGDVYLATDYRFYSVCLAGKVKVHSAVHCAVVCYRYGSVPVFRCQPRNVFYAARAVKQAVFTVQMQMTK